MSGMLPPIPTSPRASLALRLSGGLNAPLSILAASFHATCALPSTDEPALALTRACSWLAAALPTDVDLALEFALRGGHRHLAVALTSTLEPLSEAAGEAVSAALALLPPGWGFPYAAPPSFEPLPPPLLFDFASFLHAPACDADALHARAGLACPGRSPPTPDAPLPPLLIRRIPPQVTRQRAQADVGFVLWPCSLPLARWVVAHRGPLLGCPARRRVLELGSGVGLVGLVAGLCALPPFCGAGGGCGCGCALGDQPARVTLSDFNPAVLANLRHNAALNDPFLHAAHAGGGGDAEDAWGARVLGALAQGARCKEPLFRTIALDWEADAGGEPGAAPPEDDAPYDLILGSDIICSDADAAMVAGVLARRLAPRGRGLGVVCSPPPFNRWGIGALPGALAAAGLAWEERVVDAAFLADAYVAPGGAGEAEAGARGRALAEDVCVGSGFEQGCRLWLVSRP